MSSSRIYIHGLPPRITDSELKDYFSKSNETTDIKHYPNRRIAFVGYKTPEAAESAVKYFNKTFIRMSRISVEIARSILQDAANATRDRKSLKRKRGVADKSNNVTRTVEPEVENQSPEEQEESDQQPGTLSHDEWLRSRTSRTFGLENDVQSTAILQRQSNGDDGMQVDQDQEHLPKNADGGENDEDAGDEEIDLIKQSRRLFVRNLPYSVTTKELRSHFSSQGLVDEVYLPVSSDGKPKGFAFVLYNKAEDAVNAYQSFDGTSFQGRLLHIIAAKPFKDGQYSEAAIEALPPKKQREVRDKMKAASAGVFNWNSMFMNTDAVVSSVADRLGIPKADLLDPSSSDAAVRQAQAETQVIEDTKGYFEANGVDLAAFGRRERGDRAFLIKNFPYSTSISHLRALLQPYGDISRLLMPPSGTIAIVEFVEANKARMAYLGLLRQSIKDKRLLLEKAPVNLFKAEQKKMPKLEPEQPALVPKEDEVECETATLFISNLNFSTRSAGLGKALEFLDGLISATVKTKNDPKKPGQTLSMGFGFLEFKSKELAESARASINGFDLDGHQLVVKASHRGVDATEEKRKEKQRLSNKTKVIVKNLPFQTTKKDIRTLLSTYGQLRSVRVPVKHDNTIRGFAFAEFVSPKEASNAMESLKSTHLYGRKLVLEFAAGDAEDPEAQIARMQDKTGRQAAKVEAQNLTKKGRAKFSVEGQEMDE